MSDREEVDDRRETDEELAERERAMQGFFSGLMYVIEHWDEYDDETKAQFKAYYGYMLIMLMFFAMLLGDTVSRILPALK